MGSAQGNNSIRPAMNQQFSGWVMEYEENFA
jgi:hypothetical protein